VEYGKSKFFGAPSATPSKRRKSGGQKNTDFSLWSDDSIEGAMKDMPLPESFWDKGKSGKKVPVFKDQTTGSKVAATSFVDDNQETQVTAVCTQKQEVEATPPSSPEAEANRIADTSPFNASLRAEVQGLREKFSFVGGTSLFAGRSNIECTKSALLIGLNKRKSRIDRADFRTRNGKPEIIGTKTIASAGRELPIEDEPGIPDEAWNEAEEEIVVPRSDAVQLPSPVAKTHDTGQRHRLAILGSEDLLVSESDADEGSDGGTPKATKLLDLGRFAFGT
jgi:hypothetical protein